MEEQNKGLNIKMQDLWLILRGCWILVLAALLVFSIASGIFMSATHEDEYTAEVTLWALRDSASGLTNQDVSMGANLIDDYKLLIKSDSIVERVRQELNIPTKISELKGMISLSDEGRVLTLSVTAKRADRAQEIANAWGRIFCEEVNGTVSSGDDSAAMIKVWETASLPTTPSNPVNPFYAVLIGILAALLIYVFYLIRFIMDDKITVPEDVEKYLGLNVLGAVPDKNALRRRRMNPN